MLAGFDFGGVFFAFVAHFFDVFMAEQGVVVEIHFGIERDDVVLAGDDQRVDFDNRAIEVDEGVVHRHQKAARICRSACPSGPSRTRFRAHDKAACR